MMRFSVLFLMLILFSCKKKTENLSQFNHSDSVGKKTEFIQKADSSTTLLYPDSTNLKMKSQSEIDRKMVGDTIYTRFDASALPVEFEERFSNSHQQLFVVLQNFTGKEISGEIFPQNQLMNIRFNQIRTPDGNWDGPFGRTLENYAIPSHGIVLLRIGKSNMASGNASGKFSIKLQ